MVTAIQFVDSIASSPTVRLDVNADEWLTIYSGLDLSPPPLKTAVASTLLQDGDQIPSSAYANRTLRIPLELTAASEDAAATELQALNRELNRPTNILKYQVDTTNPVFFRTFRSPDYRWEHASEGASVYYRTLLELRAEPFGYGLLETPVSGVTVSTDPAAASNPCYVDVTGVKGDVEAPAIIQWPRGSGIGGSSYQSLFAVRRRGTPGSAPFLIQAEAMTQGTDTTTQPNDANFSGSGNNYSRCTFTTATMQTRLSVTTVGTAGVDLRGRYRVFLRYRRSSATGEINVQLRWGSDSTTEITNTAFATSGTALAAADLGEISMPMGVDPVTGSDGTEMSVANNFRLTMQAERTSGTSTIDFDFLALIPADDRTGIVQWNSLSTSYDHVLLDAEDTSVVVRDSSNRIFSTNAASVSGGFPMLSPGQTNRLYMLRSVAATGSVWSLTTVSPVSVSYLPRYLSVRPAST